MPYYECHRGHEFQGEKRGGCPYCGGEVSKKYTKEEKADIYERNKIVQERSEQIREYNKLVDEKIRFVELGKRILRSINIIACHETGVYDEYYSSFLDDCRENIVSRKEHSTRMTEVIPEPEIDSDDKSVFYVFSLIMSVVFFFVMVSDGSGGVPNVFFMILFLFSVFFAYWLRSSEKSRIKRNDEAVRKHDELIIERDIRIDNTEFDVSDYELKEEVLEEIETIKRMAIKDCNEWGMFDYESGLDSAKKSKKSS